MQWKDAEGNWHDVETWQSLLSLDFGKNQKYQYWWVAPANFGEKPFRWLVKRSQSGEVLATSPEFTLPLNESLLVKTEVTLKP